MSNTVDGQNNDATKVRERGLAAKPVRGGVRKPMCRIHLRKDMMLILSVRYKEKKQPQLIHMQTREATDWYPFSFRSTPVIHNPFVDWMGPGSVYWYGRLCCSWNTLSSCAGCCRRALSRMYSSGCGSQSRFIDARKLSFNCSTNPAPFPSAYLGNYY